MLSISISQTHQKQQASFGAKYKEVEYALFTKKNGSILSILRQEIGQNNFKDAVNTIDNAHRAVNNMYFKRKLKLKRTNTPDQLTKFNEGKNNFERRASVIKEQLKELVNTFQAKYGEYIPLQQRIKSKKPALSTNIKVQKNMAAIHA